MVPLLGIAFVVAILCTGLFYGAFSSRFTTSAAHPRQVLVVAAHDLAAGAVLKREDVKIAEVQAEVTPKGMFSTTDQVNGRMLVVAAPEGTPILEPMLGSAVTDSGIPVGMRAMTIRPADSSSIVKMLQPGRRIDIQAWSNRGGEDQLRTILEDVEVVSVPRENDAAASNAITVLVPVSNMDVVALADSAAHVRIALRNSDDSATTGAKPVGMAALFQSREAQPASPARAASIPALAVSVLAVNEAGLRKLGAQAASAPGLCMRDLRDNEQWEETIRQAVAAKEAVQVTAARVGGSYGDTLQFGNKSWRFRLRFEPGGATAIWIEPEIVRTAGSVVTTQRTRGHIDATGTGARAVLIGGVGGAEAREALSREGGLPETPMTDLIVVMRSDAPALRAALPGTGR